jgi:cell wall-associated NlpC family hydrolase
MRLRTSAIAALTAASSITGPAARPAKARPAARSSPARPAKRISFADALSHRSGHAPTRADVAVAIARAQLGKPYRWGGAGPDAFDCSGLAAYAWAGAGVALPHSSGAQYASVPHVPLDAMRPGDLVFSRGHVGIYIGDARMIHAPQTGRSVEIAPIHRVLIGAGRPAA